MKRKEFIEKCTALGLGAIVFPTLAVSCTEEPQFIEGIDVNFNGKVLIIGAGAAGLAAGHLLNQYNIDFEIIEAASVYGGRIKEISNFADFPIDLGGEWIHTDPSVLGSLLNDPNSSEEVDIIKYRPRTISAIKNGEVKRRNFFSNFYSEYKFKNTTWFGFFEDYILPGIRNKIVLNSPVTNIDYSGARIEVTNSTGQIFEADKLILTVPTTILQDGLINFTPSLPQTKIDAWNNINMPDGIKVFMEFSERFYPDISLDGGIAASDDEGSKVYYDAAFNKDSSLNILGLFAVGIQASVYTDLPSDQARVEFILNELDELFDGKASPNYVKHVIQNWSAEPYVGGSYSHNMDDGIQSTIKQPVDSKLFFAGEAYADDWATVHGAGLSGMTVAEEIIKEN